MGKLKFSNLSQEVNTGIASSLSRNLNLKKPLWKTESPNWLEQRRKLANEKAPKSKKRRKRERHQLNKLHSDME
jgi:hypothetical protein